MLQFWQMMICPLAVKVPINIINRSIFDFFLHVQITNLSRTAFKIIWKQKQTEFARTNSVKCSPGVLQMLQFWQMMIRPLAVKVPINIILHMHQQQKLIRSISKQICMICMHSYHHLLRLQSFSLRAQGRKKFKIRRRGRGESSYVVGIICPTWSE